MESDSRILVAGHNGLVGSAVYRALRRYEYNNVFGAGREMVDLTKRDAVNTYFALTKPEYVFLCAAKVGGILANRNYPGEFIHQNLQIQTNVIDACRNFGVKKMLFLGSSCIYPKMCSQPIKEEYLLTGPLEDTNRAYAIAKIAGIEMVQSYARQYGMNGICLMPTNLFGPGDNFDLNSSHVLPALIRKFHNAKVNDDQSVTCWGTGLPRREFLHVDDLADACIFLMQHYASPEVINVGCGEDISIKDLAAMVSRIVGYDGQTVWDATKPDGTMRKLLDVSRVTALGWYPRIGLEEGIISTYEWFLSYHSDT